MCAEPIDRRIFVCSDWHLGGTADEAAAFSGGRRGGTGICRSAIQISRFIDWISEESEENDGVTELVINGDAVDFLIPDGDQEPTEWEPDENAVIAKLQRLIERSKNNGRGPFDALADFVRRPKTELTILLGNHDVELSLPCVRRFLELQIGARFRFVYDGEAYARGRLLIEHGNRYDCWNALKTDNLRRERSLLSRGLAVEEASRDPQFFRPPAGSLMVICGVNRVQPQFPFINLLKPEGGAAVPLLLAIAPDLWAVLNKAFQLTGIAERLWEARRKDAVTPANPEFLGAGAGGSDIEQVLHLCIGEDAALFSMPPSQEGGLLGADLPSDVWQWLREKSRMVGVKIRDCPEKIVEITNELRLRQLDAAFAALANDRSFNLNEESEPYLSAAKHLAASGRFDVIVFGHTHLPKYVEFDRPNLPRARYLNTGTWADTIRLSPELCGTGPTAIAARRAFIRDMANGHLEPYLFRSLGYAEIEMAGEKVVSAELRSFTRHAQRAAPLQPFA